MLLRWRGELVTLGFSGGGGTDLDGEETGRLDVERGNEGTLELGNGGAWEGVMGGE